MVSIEVRQARDSDSPTWNEIVLHSSNGWLMHTWDWSEIVKHLGYERFFWLGESGGEAVAVFSGYLKRYSKLRDLVNITTMTSSALGYGGVCVLSDFARPDEANHALLQGVDSAASSQGILSSQITLQPFTAEENYLPSHGYRPMPHHTFIVDLGSTLDSLWGSVRKAARNDVRKAKRLGVKTRVATNTADFDEFYRLHLETYRRTGLEPRPRNYFWTIWQTLRPKGFAELLMAELDGAVIGCNLVLKSRFAALYAAGASDWEYRASGSGSLLQWETIRRSKEQNIRKYDLGAVAFPKMTQKEKTIYTFKSHWGGVLTQAAGGVRFYSRSGLVLHDLYKLSRSI